MFTPAKSFTHTHLSLSWCRWKNYHCQWLGIKQYGRSGALQTQWWSHLSCEALGMEINSLSLLCRECSFLTCA